MRKLSYPGRSNVLAQNGMVATSNPLSSMVAINVLQKGGNAVDAAIAASAVQAVVCPSATGIGGDCFAIISMNGKKPIAVNGSGIAPKKANLQFYKDNKIKNIGLTSPHSVTIPGAVHAWCSMHEKFGRIDFKEVLYGEENFARRGFPVHEVEAIAWKENEKKLKKNPNSKRLFLNQNLSYSYGEVFKNIPLANTLRVISKNKIKGFYQSEITKDMVKTLNKLGGLHTEEDFYNQKTLFSSSSLDKSLKLEKGSNKDAAFKVGENIASKAVKAGFKDSLCFDRGSYIYHGRIKELAEGARSKGLKL